MRRYFFFIICILATLFLQLLFSSQINPLQVRPDFFLAAVIFLSFYCRFYESLFIALLAGSLQDSFSAGIFGASALAYTVCVILLDVYKRYIYREDLYLKEILVVALSLVAGWVNFFLYLSRLPLPWVTAVFRVILPQSLYTALVAPGLFWIMRKCALKYSL
ncbi:MAG: rod shape-determining protein MreD [Candidatus Omnitrophota bacterium]